MSTLVFFFTLSDIIKKEVIKMKKRNKVYDLYWYFAYERQNIFLKKKNGEPAP